MGQPLHLE